MVKDVPQLPVDHSLYWMEHAIKAVILKKKDIHDAEHEDMLVDWGCKPEHTSKLTIRFDEENVAFADRLYHIMLHLRYWKDNPERFEDRQEYVSRFEDETKFNLDELTLPNPKSRGESVY